MDTPASRLGKQLHENSGAYGFAVFLLRKSLEDYRLDKAGLGGDLCMFSVSSWHTPAAHGCFPSSDFPFRVPKWMPGGVLRRMRRAFVHVDVPLRIFVAESGKAWYDK